MLLATMLVAVLPVSALWGLRAEGIADSFGAATALGAVLSLGIYPRVGVKVGP